MMSEANGLDPRAYLGYVFTHEACECRNFAAAVGSTRSDQAATRFEREEARYLLQQVQVVSSFPRGPDRNIRRYQLRWPIPPILSKYDEGTARTADCNRSCPEVVKHRPLAA